MGIYEVWGLWQHLNALRFHGLIWKEVIHRGYPQMEDDFEKDFKRRQRES